MVTLGIVGLFVHRQYSRPEIEIEDAPLPLEPVSLDEAAVAGAPTAQVILIEYGDFQCPACAQFARLTAPFIDEYYVKPGRVRRVYRHYLLRPSDPITIKAAEVASCATRQGRFWEVYRAFHTTGDLSGQPWFREHEGALDGLARRMGLNVDSFSACLRESARRDIQMDVGSGKLLNVKATPTLFVGIAEADGRVRLKKRIVGFVSGPELAKTLDWILGDKDAAMHRSDGS